MALEEDIRDFLLDDATFAALVGTRLYVNELHHDPSKDSRDFAFLQQTGSSDDAALNDSAGAPNRLRFTLECVSLQQSKMRSMVSRAQALLNKKRGTVGDSTVLGIFAAEQSDDYEPRSISDTSSYKLGALMLEVVT